METWSTPQIPVVAFLLWTCSKQVNVFSMLWTPELDAGWWRKLICQISGQACNSKKKVAELLPLEERNMILSSRVLSSTVPQDSHFPRTSRAIGRISFSFHLTLASSAPKQTPQLASFLKEIGRYCLDLTTSILRFLTDLRGKECSLSLTPLTGIMPV